MLELDGTPNGMEPSARSNSIREANVDFVKRSHSVASSESTRL